MNVLLKMNNCSQTIFCAGDYVAYLEGTSSTSTCTYSSKLLLRVAIISHSSISGVRPGYEYIHIFVSRDEYRHFNYDFQKQLSTSEIDGSITVTECGDFMKYRFYTRRPHAQMFFNIYELKFMDGLTVKVMVSYVYELEYQRNRDTSNMMRLLPLLASKTEQVGLLINSQVLTRVASISDHDNKEKVKFFGSPFSLSWYCLNKMKISLT